MLVSLSSLPIAEMSPCVPKHEMLHSKFLVQRLRLCNVILVARFLLVQQSDPALMLWWVCCCAQQLGVNGAAFARPAGSRCLVGPTCGQGRESSPSPANASGRRHLSEDSTAGLSGE
jgi:hypothetical protein